MKISYNEFIDELKKYQNIERSIFSKRILNTKLNVLGLDTPTLKKVAKEYFDIDLNSFKLNEYFEVNFLFFYISLKRIKSLNEQIIFLNENIEYIDNWAIVDQTVRLLNNPTLLDLINLTEKEKEFLIRYGYVGMLPFTKEKNNTDIILKSFKKDERYYVNMAEGWVLSYILINDFEKGIAWIKDNNEQFKDIIKIGIQKAIDSFRVSEDNKKILKNVRNELKNTFKSNLCN